MKRSIAWTLLILQIVACTVQTPAYGKLTPSPEAPVVSSATPTVVASPTVPVAAARTITIPPPPLRTATPRPFDSSHADVVKAMDGLFNMKACSKEDYLTAQPPAGSAGFVGDLVSQLRFVDISKDVLLMTLYADGNIKEVADNTDRQFTAYLVEQPMPELCSSCIRPEVYFQDHLRSRLYRIEWKGYAASRYLHNVSWLGEFILAFFQNMGPHSDQLIGIDVKQQSVRYYAGISCP